MSWFKRAIDRLQGKSPTNWLGDRVINQVGNRTVLDIGCGILNAFGGRPIGSQHMCVDAFPPYIERLQEQGRSVVLGKAPEVMEQFEDQSWDCVLLLDVLEHLTRQDAEQALSHAERIARDEVIVFTPNGFLEQHGWEAWGLPHNELQAHRCGFRIEELEQRGYRCQIDRSTSEQHGDIEHLYGVRQRSVAVRAA